jgi:hypothetical protein
MGHQIKAAPHRPARRITASLLFSVGISIVVVTASCGDGTGPEEEGPPEAYAFVLTTDAEITIAGEVAAYAIDTKDESLLEVRELLGGTVPEREQIWEGVTMVRAALEGGGLEPPTPLHAAFSGVPTRVTVGDRTVLVVGMEFTFLQIVGGSGSLTLEGTVNGEVEVSASASAGGEGIGKLVLGSVPGG